VKEPEPVVAAVFESRYLASNAVTEITWVTVARTLLESFTVCPSAKPKSMARPGFAVTVRTPVPTSTEPVKEVPMLLATGVSVPDRVHLLGAVTVKRVVAGLAELLTGICVPAPMLDT
jgi:hypothetical protein